MRVYLKTEGGFTLIELVIVVVIIGVLAAVAIPMYSRYLTSSKAAEATTQIQVLLEYAQGYIRAHPNNWSASGMILAFNANESGTAANDQAWMRDICGNTPVYFTYYYDGPEVGASATATNGATAQSAGTSTIIEAVGGRTTTSAGAAVNNPFTTADWLRAQINNDGIATWTASDGKMSDIKPSD